MIQASPVAPLLDSVARQIRDLLIDAEEENVGLSQELLEETHEDLNSLEDCVKRRVGASEQAQPAPSSFVRFPPHPSCFFARTTRSMEAAPQPALFSPDRPRFAVARRFRLFLIRITIAR